MAAGAVEVAVTSNNSKACANFDGVDDYVEVPHNINQLGANLSNGFTISAWIMPKSSGEGTQGTIIDKNYGTNGFGIKLLSSPVCFFKINNSTFIKSGSDYTFGEWTHFLITVSSTPVGNFYANGVLSGSADQAINQNISTITTTNAPRIGNVAGGTTGTFDGAIAQVKMWNKVLTADEIALDYAGSPVAGTIIDVPLQDNYDGVTNSGTYLGIQEDAIAAVIKADRVTANDKYIIAGLEGGQIVSAVIEEAP